MTERPYFHVAFIVKDLAEAIEHYGGAMGIEFLDPIVAKARFYERGCDERDLELRLTYSRQAAGPWVEIIEAQGDGIYDLSKGEGMHHVGIWESDCETRVQDMKDKGIDLLAAQYTPEGKIIVAYFAPENLHGTILEIVDEGRKESMAKWFAGGAFTD